MVAAKATGKEQKMRTREIEVQFLYDELAVPPKCRSARVHEVMGTHIAKLAEPDPDEAPVALIARRPGEEPVEYRLFGHELYVKESQPLRAKAYAPSCYHHGVNLLEDPREGYEPKPVTKDLPTEANFPVRNKESCESRIRSWSSERIVVGGELWKIAAEPSYEIGWDGALKISEDWQSWTCEFSALEEKEARAKAEDFAAEFLAHTTRAAIDNDTIEVLIPEAVAYPTVAEAAEVRKLKKELNALEETLRTADLKGIEEFEPGLYTKIASSAKWKQVELETLAKELGKRFGRGTKLAEDELDIAAVYVIRNC